MQLVVLPLFHTGGLNCYANPVLHAGGTIVIMRTFDPGQALDCLSDPALGITTFRRARALPVHDAASEIRDGPTSARACASPVSARPALAILETWTARGVPLQGQRRLDQPYRHHARRRCTWIRKLGSAGKALLHTAIRVVDDQDNDVPAGGIACASATKGPMSTTPGYWNNPEATKRSFTNWLAAHRRCGAA